MRISHTIKIYFYKDNASVLTLNMVLIISKGNTNKTGLYYSYELCEISRHQLLFLTTVSKR